MIFLLFCAMLAASAVAECDLYSNDPNQGLVTDCTAGTLTRGSSAAPFSVSFEALNATMATRACSYDITLSIVNGVDYFFSHNHIVDNNNGVVFLQMPHDSLGAEARGIPGGTRILISVLKGREGGWSDTFKRVNVTLSEGLARCEPIALTDSARTELSDSGDVHLRYSIDYYECPASFAPDQTQIVLADTLEDDNRCTLTAQSAAQQLTVPANCTFGHIRVPSAVWTSTDSAGRQLRVDLATRECAVDQLVIGNPTWRLGGQDGGLAYSQLTPTTALLERKNVLGLPYWVGTYEVLSAPPRTDAFVPPPPPDGYVVLTLPHYSTMGCNQGLYQLRNNGSEPTIIRFLDTEFSSCYEVELFTVGSRRIAFDLFDSATESLHLYGTLDMNAPRVLRFKARSQLINVYISGYQTNLHLRYTVHPCSSQCDEYTRLCFPDSAPRCATPVHVCDDGVRLPVLPPDCKTPQCPPACQSLYYCESCVADGNGCKFCFDQSNGAAECLALGATCSAPAALFVTEPPVCPVRESYRPRSLPDCSAINDCGMCQDEPWCTWCALPAELQPAPMMPIAEGMAPVLGRCVTGTSAACDLHNVAAESCERYIGVCAADEHRCSDGTVLYRALPDCQFPSCPTPGGVTAFLVVLLCIIACCCAGALGYIFVQYMRARGVRMPSSKFGY